MGDKEIESLVLQITEKENILKDFESKNTEWTTWAEQRSVEINELLLKEVELKRLVQEKEEQLQKIGNVNLIKAKDLEIIDLKETIDRLDTEKGELNDEIVEVRKQLDDLQNM